MPNLSEEKFLVSVPHYLAGFTTRELVSGKNVLTSRDSAAVEANAATRKVVDRDPVK
jgi:hypothetical protein